MLLTTAVFAAEDGKVWLKLTDSSDGKGIKIAVIDTGIDTTHQNFQAMTEDKLTADSASAASVAAVLDQLNASDRYNGLRMEDVYYNNTCMWICPWTMPRRTRCALPTMKSRMPICGTG